MHDCNCPWTLCSVHPGALCPNSAWEGPPDCGCDDAPHTIGDTVLAPGIHLCSPCGTAAATLLLDDLGDLMNRLHPAIPRELRPLEQLLRDYFTARMDTGHAWPTLMRDVHAIMGFTSCLVSRMTPTQCQAAITYVRRFNSFRDALKGVTR